MPVCCAPDRTGGMSVIDSTAEEIGTEVDTYQPHAPVALFGTTDPVEVLQKASAVAAALKDVLKAQGMVQNIKGKEYVKVEGWQTLGSMLGIVPVVVWTRPIDGGWEARVEARTSDGRIVGAAESMCVEQRSPVDGADPCGVEGVARPARVRGHARGLSGHPGRGDAAG
jgi:hypothetical protein